MKDYQDVHGVVFFLTKAYCRFRPQLYITCWAVLSV